MTTRDPLDDETLARLLATRWAVADPATRERALARVRAGLVPSGGAAPAWLAWLERPAALATAVSLLVVSLGAGVWLADHPSSSASASTSSSTDLIGSLLLDETGTDAVIGGAGLDSGSVP